MSSKITLSIVAGDDRGKSYRFAERANCIVGREPGCTIQIREKVEGGKYISRRHFMLDINPPNVVIRDLGSRSGTYLRRKADGGKSEVLIGRRDTVAPAANAEKFPDHSLVDGDEIRINTTLFRVQVAIAAICDSCQAEVLSTSASHSGPVLCATCLQRGMTRTRERPARPRPAICAQCGQDVSREVGSVTGDYVCEKCRLDPVTTLQGNFRVARQGDVNMNVLQGLKFIKELGRGRSGCVCLAQVERSGEYRAVKMLLPERATEDHEVKRFRGEFENTKALRHPNIVILHEYSHSRGSYYFTSEFCDAQSLDQEIAASRTGLPVKQALEFAFQILDGLDHAHRAEIPHVELADGSRERGIGLVHRDIKPGNILLKRDGQRVIPKIADFGLAKVFTLAGLTGNTYTGESAGTPGYMPRQQALDFKYAEPSVDVWAAAATLYSMLTKACPRDFNRNVENVWTTIITREPVPIRQRNPRVPEPLAKVIDQALDDSGDLRFATAVEFKRTLQQVC